MAADNNEVSFEYRVLGKRGHIQLVVHMRGVATFTDKLDVTDAEGRDRCLKRLVAKYTGLDRAGVDRELDRIAAEVAAAGAVEPEEPDAVGKEDAELLVEIATNEEEVELFHHGNGRDAEAYATIKVEGHSETWLVRSSGFSHWIRRQFYILCKRAPGSQAFNDAIRLIASIAIFDGTHRKVFVRVAGYGDAIYIDLANDEWQVVRITKDGWTVIDGSLCPVRFTRRRGMLGLPLPVRGGHIEELRPFVNCPTDDLWHLHAGSLVSLFRPRGPYPVLAWTGEQGSAKSSAAKRTRSLIDPNLALLRRLPREERDLMISAKNSFVQGYDNISTIPPSISDALCSLTTGGGFATRELYSDDEETIIDVARPVLLNGIADVATRADLLDRSVILSLPPIDEKTRREEEELDAAFALAQPRILGALLDATSTALRRYSTTTLERRPRMLDFARWCTAAEVSYGWAEGTFLDAYMRNRSDAVAIAVEASAVGGPVLKFMENRESWAGTAGELLGLLETGFTDQKTLERREWPKTPKGLADAIRRIAPPLRTLGVDAIFGEREAGGMRERLLTLRKIEPQPEPREPGDDDDPDGDDPEGDGSSAPGAGARDDWDGWDDRVARSDVDEHQKPEDPQRLIPRPLSPEVATQPSQASQPSRDTVESGRIGQARPPTCRNCRGARFWRRSGGGPAVCATCHPPELAPVEIEWIEPVKRTGSDNRG